MTAIKDALASAAEALHISGDKEKKAIGGGAPGECFLNLMTSGARQQS